MSTPETRAVAVVPAHLEALRSAKILDHHLARKAIVYVRQSAPSRWSSTRSRRPGSMPWPTWLSRWAGRATASRSST